MNINTLPQLTHSELVDKRILETTPPTPPPPETLDRMALLNCMFGQIHKLGHVDKGSFLHVFKQIP